MSFQPTLDRVLVRPIEAATTTAGGIILADNYSQSKTQQGDVLNVGPGVFQNAELAPVMIATGDVVTYLRGAGVEVTSDGEKLLLIREGDILGYESNDEVVED